MVDTQTLFNRTLDELKLRINTNEEYDLLMASSLLRKLLIDRDNSLIFQISKSNVPLKFKVNIRTPLHVRIPSLFTGDDLKTYSWSVENGFDPETTNTQLQFNPQELGLDDFLSQVVIYTKGVGITVRDLIKHLSDKEGGVHKQRKAFGIKEEKNILIRELGELFGINNISAGLRTLKSIGEVVYRGLSIYRK